MRWCLEDTSIKVPANGRFPLFGPCRKSPACPETVQFCKPFADIRDHRFEKDPFLHPADPHLVALETEFFWEAHGLTSPVPE